MRFSICPLQMNRILRADLHTWMGQAALTAVRHKYTLFMTCVAGKFYDVDERRRIVRLRLVGRLDVVGNRRRLRCAPVRKPHGKAQTFSYNGTFQKYIIPEVSHLTRNNLIRQFLDPLINRPLRMVGHAGHLAENSVSDFLNSGFHTSHADFLLFRADTMLSGVLLSSPQVSLSFLFSFVKKITYSDAP